jgi:hypothetical protein
MYVIPALTTSRLGLAGIYLHSSGPKTPIARAGKTEAGFRGPSDGFTAEPQTAVAV